MDGHGSRGGCHQHWLERNLVCRGIYQTVKKFLSAWLPVLGRIPLFQSQELPAAPCTCRRWQPRRPRSWEQPFPPNATSSLTIFLPLLGPGSSPVTTGHPLRWVLRCSSMRPLCRGWCRNFLESSCSVDFTCWAIIKWINLIISLNFIFFCIV